MRSEINTSSDCETMNKEDYERFSRMIESVKDEGDRACALILTANLDNRLSELIVEFSVELSKERRERILDGFLSTFSSRITLCYMMGLIAKNEFDDLHRIRDIRNLFAHEESGLNFKEAKISNWCKSLFLIQEMTRDYPEFKDHCKEPRDAFVICAASLTLLLLNRKKNAISQKRTVPPAGRIFPPKREGNST